ncbi:MAG: efflux RND transporter permease subunit, partial [Planctomycetota bacterium]
SLNQLSLFGLVLAIGIVVDDAIVVVENCERLLKQGRTSEQAAHEAMDEVGGALIATTLVLIAVFVPTAFIPGISGQFYRQFAITIAISTAFSTFVSLTLTPALCALLLRPAEQPQDKIDDFLCFIFGWFFWPFNKFFGWASERYAWSVGKVVRVTSIGLILYAGLLGATYWMFQKVPTGFIPEQDQGYLIVSIELPPGRNLDETDEVVRKVADLALSIDGIERVVQFVGFSGATRARASNSAAMFPTLSDAKERADQGRTMPVILNELRQKVAAIDDAFVIVIPPPAVQGIGTGGGVKLQIQDRAGGDLSELEDAAGQIIAGAAQDPSMVQPFSNFRTRTPQLYADVDRTRARQLQVPISNVFETLQVYLGSAYVNDFNYLGRTYQVNVQADSSFRDEENDILRLRTRSDRGGIVPLGSLVKLKDQTGPDRVVRFNLYPAADVNVSAAPGSSTGTVISKLEKMAAELPDNFSYAWTDLAFQQKQAGNLIVYIFPLCVLFVFLTLSAQYENWILPLAIILIVPMCLLCAIVGVHLRGIANNILVQIGFIVLVGLACKNAILIVEFAKQQEEDDGKSPIDAAVEACRLRLRPILMTALSFVLGVIPLLIATGAGSEMRVALGTAVFSGTLGVTIFGLFLTPIFYVVLRKTELAFSGGSVSVDSGSSTSDPDTPGSSDQKHDDSNAVGDEGESHEDANDELHASSE